MRCGIGIRRRGWAVATLGTLLAVSACASRPEIGMEAPGRPEVTWHGTDAEAVSVPTDKETEHRLLAEVDAAEKSGSDELLLARALYNLAILRRQQGQLDDAKRLYQRVLDIRERQQGADHPEVATTLNNLAGIEAAQGHYAEAQRLLERVVRIRQAALGPEDALTAQSLNNLGLLYAAQGNAAAAEPLYQHALAILEKANTTAPGDLVRVLDNYAALLRDTGRDAEAEELEAQARVRRPPAEPQH